MQKKLSHTKRDTGIGVSYSLHECAILSSMK